MAWIVIILLALILFAVLGSRGKQRRSEVLEAGGKEAFQRKRLRQLATEAAGSRSNRRQAWGRETLERLQREDDSLAGD